MRTNEAKGISDIVLPRRSGAGREQLGTGRLRRGGGRVELAARGIRMLGYPSNCFADLGVFWFSVVL